MEDVVVGRKPRFLVALDFDNTMIRHSAKRMINVQPLFAGGVVPEDLLTVKKERGWDQFVLASFKHLFQIGVTRSEHFSLKTLLV